jgi:hypothetical protein
MLTLHRARFYSAAREKAGIDNTYEPLQGLRRHDADLTLIALLSSVEFSTQVQDPWFLALKRKTIYDITPRVNRTVFLPNSPIMTMGCIAQVINTNV